MDFFLIIFSAPGSGSATVAECATNIEELETLYVKDKKLIVMKRNDIKNVDAFDFVEGMSETERIKLYEDGFKDSDKMVRTRIQ